MPHGPRIGTLAAVGLLAALATSTVARAQPAAARDGVHALGRLLPETGLIAVGSRPGQRIDEIKVAIGDDVKAGQTLAVLEGLAQARAQLDLAAAQKDAADFQRQAKIDQFALERERFERTQGPRAEAAKTVADALRKLLDRATPLYKVGDLAANVAPGTVDKAKLEDEGKYVELLAKTVQAELDVKLLDVEKALTAKKNALEDAQVARDDPEKKTTGNPEFLIPDHQVVLAKAAAEAALVRAPRDGKVLDVLARAGEVGTGQLLLLGDVSKMVAETEVFQSDALRVKIGDAATVKILDRSVAGKVTRVGTVVGRNQAANPDPRALRDVRVVKVLVTLDDPEPAARLVNMEVNVVITPSGGG